MEKPWKSQLEALGSLIRAQRRAARLSLRDLAELSDVSNAYLSQIERGLHEPSVRVLKSIAAAINLSAEALLAQAGLLEESGDAPPGAATEAAISADPRLTDEQKRALIAVYRGFVSDAPE